MSDTSSEGSSVSHLSETLFEEEEPVEHVTEMPTVEENADQEEDSSSDSSSGSDDSSSDSSDDDNEDSSEQSQRNKRKSTQSNATKKNAEPKKKQQRLQGMGITEKESVARSMALISDVIAEDPESKSRIQSQYEWIHAAEHSSIFEQYESNGNYLPVKPKDSHMRPKDKNVVFFNAHPSLVDELDGKTMSLDSLTKTYNLTDTKSEQHHLVLNPQKRKWNICPVDAAFNLTKKIEKPHVKVSASMLRDIGSGSPKPNSSSSHKERKSSSKKRKSSQLSTNKKRKRRSSKDTKIRKKRKRVIDKK